MPFDEVATADVETVVEAADDAVDDADDDEMDDDEVVVVGDGVGGLIISVRDLDDFDVTNVTSLS